MTKTSIEYEEIVGLGAERALEIFAAMSPSEASLLLKRKSSRDMRMIEPIAKLLSGTPTFDAVAWTLSRAGGCDHVLARQVAQGDGRAPAPGRGCDGGRGGGPGPRLVEQIWSELMEMS